MEPEGSLLCSQKTATEPYPEPTACQGLSPGPRRSETFR